MAERITIKSNIIANFDWSFTMLAYNGKPNGIKN